MKRDTSILVAGACYNGLANAVRIDGKGFNMNRCGNYMYVHQLRVICLLLLTSMMSACGSSSEAPTTTAGDNKPAKLIPLAQGNKWVWETTTFDPGGLVTGSRIDSTIIIDSTIVANEVWFTNQFNIYSINRSDGFWVASQPGSGSLLYKYPASVSDWYLYGISNPDEFYIMVMSVSETVVIPPDTFLCYKYRRYPLGGGLVDTTYHYIEPGIGLTKTDIFDGLGRLKTRQELIRLTLTEANPAGGDLP